ncbi:hypothetical protein CDES_01870 [Corynebacterium deserti GIMN1.010]|uniref:Uncharacterized protein n=1 Tax=Corynebacterium deserti GIMN1.010 TaxID=931089 RepID=A0A0M4CE86_9CORY|nr:hypothetical protein [Corynebacterium deserti]ALC04840.1 hypothetical protein CDES_01870 [Corynebacterium deserti GIMN1.010]
MERVYGANDHVIDPVAEARSEAILRRAIDNEFGFIGGAYYLFLADGDATYIHEEDPDPYFIVIRTRSSEIDELLEGNNVEDRLIEGSYPEKQLDGIGVSVEKNSEYFFIVLMGITPLELFG